VRQLTALSRRDAPGTTILSTREAAQYQTIFQNKIRIPTGRSDLDAY
jgi:hypothetical protein